MSVIERIYDDISKRKNAPKDYQKYVPGMNGRIDRCDRFFEQGLLKSGTVMIDIGGAIGDLGDSLRNLFETIWINDVSSIPLAAARTKGHSTWLGNVDEEPIPFNDGTVDFIAMLDVIEHIMDPEKLARECARVLKTGGQAYVNTPNIMHWRHIEYLFRHRMFPHTSGDREVFHGGHTAFFTRRDIDNIFSNAGLSCRLLKDESTMDSPPVWIQNFMFDNYAARNTLSIQSAMDDLSYPDVLLVAEKI